MGAFKDFLTAFKSGLSAIIPYGGTLDTPSEEDPIIMAAKTKGGFFVVPNLETLADIPYKMLSQDMEVSVSEHTRPGGTIHPRTRYYLYSMPPSNTRVSEISQFLIESYWRKATDDVKFNAEIQTQYAPNFQGSRPLFLATEISSAAYQAGYANDTDYGIGNPALKIWSDTYDPKLGHVWQRQRIGAQNWGVPISMGAGNYETNQYIDVIFKWVTKASGVPARPIQPNDNAILPTDWQNTPGSNYATLILTQDLYRSQAVKNAFGILKSEWDTPVLVSSDPALVRYGNQPGNTDFLNDTYWRGYYTPGRDTFQATRPSGGSSNWTVTKIDQESGEFPDFVFKAFPIGTQQIDLIAGTPTLPVPFTTTAPNDWKDAPFDVAVTEVLYMSTATKYADGSLKSTWSVPKRFDGLDTIQAVIDETPGDTFYKTRQTDGTLAYAFSTIAMVATLYKGPTPLTAGITAYNWYRGGTLIIFSGITHLATNLGALNAYHTISSDGKTLTVTPEAVDNTTIYKVGITHSSRTTDYENTIQLFDATDDGLSYFSDIISVSGNTFKNQVGLYQFNAQFYKGGVLDNTNVTFKWSIKNTSGTALTGALRNSGGTSIGDTDVVATSVYVSGADISQYATLILEADFGTVVKFSRVTLTDVQDGQGLEALYWGTGSTDPGPPTDFIDRTITKTAVIALSIGYSATPTGRWYIILREGGIWNQPLQMRAESARPNGGMSLSIYKNVQISLGAPSAPSVPGSGSIVPSGWTTSPTAFAGLEDATFVTSCFFLLRTDVAADPTVLTRDNYNPNGSYGTPKKITGDGAGSPGAPGDNGWSPVFTLVYSGGNQFLYLSNWVGGTGAMPSGAGGSSSYVGAAGLTTIGNAINLKGDPGDATQVRPQYYASVGTWGNGAGASLPNAAVVVLQTLTIYNTWNQTRYFKIYGHCGFRNDSGVDIPGVLLESQAAEAPGFWSYMASAKETIGIGGDSPAYAHNIAVGGFLAIPAGSWAQVQITVRDVVGGACYRNTGFIEAFGL